MATSIALLRDLAPEFKLFDAALLTRALADAALQVRADAYGSLYQRAAITLAAHILTVSQRGQSQGGQQPNEAPIGAMPHNRTKWLDEFERISAMVPGSPYVITG